MRAALGVAAAAAHIVLCTLPFLPGDYDPLAVPLSMMARALGLTSLLLAVQHARQPGWKCFRFD
ncbi:MAG: hypothetical protein M3R55_13585 [Acidobacteriota bacterium]|nr:hypothetical protein [Acidobacteriota bacterium]